MSGFERQVRKRKARAEYEAEYEYWQAEARRHGTELRAPQMPKSKKKRQRLMNLPPDQADTAKT